MGVMFALVQSPWAQGLPIMGLLALPGIQGALTAKNAFDQSRLARFSPILVSVELVCAGFLVVAAGVALLGAKSLPMLYGSWVVAAIATLMLVIVAALDLTGGIRHRQNQRRALLKLLLQSVALILYIILLLWMGLLLFLSLTGESYMGN
jgi:hypothetical protein